MTFFLKDKYKPGTTEYNLIEFTEKNWEFIINNSMVNVAKKLYVNPSTLTRTVQKLGFTKYNDFRHYILVQSNEYKDIDSILTRKDFKDSVKNLYQVNKFVIEETYKNLDLKNLEEIISLIDNSDRIITYGLGFSGYLGTQLCKYLRLLGKECVDLNNIYDLLKFTTPSNFGTWIIISRTLAKREILFGLRKVLKNSQNDVIVITNQEVKVPISVTNKIQFKSLDETDHFFEISSKISLLFIINLILISLWSKKNISLTDKVEEFNLETKEWKK